MSTRLNRRYLNEFVDFEQIKAMSGEIEAAHCKIQESFIKNKEIFAQIDAADPSEKAKIKDLEKKLTPTGWYTLPEDYDREEFARIKAAAKKMQKIAGAVIVVGIGGSYLGTRAAIEFIKSPLYNCLKKDTPDVYYAGNTLSPSAMYELLELCADKDICLIVISKSGETTEPAIAFRQLREYMELKYSEKEMRERIFVVTDKRFGSLKELSNEKGYETFVVPSHIGGRYSVLTAVGLLPIAVAGIDIDALMTGAKLAMCDFAACDLEKNDCYQYAAIRNYLYRRGKKIEILVAYEAFAAMTAEWWKQLYGESEGKDGKGLFPASVINTTDLHSMGQYIQEGERTLFETVIKINGCDADIVIPKASDNRDNLNYLADSEKFCALHNVNEVAFMATAEAHVDGGVPNIVLELDSRSAEDFGYMVYFFELACAVSGYMLGINPFNQPGVEAYKQNMFRMLGKPNAKK